MTKNRSWLTYQLQLQKTILTLQQRPKMYPHKSLWILLNFTKRKKIIDVFTFKTLLGQGQLNPWQWLYYSCDLFKQVSQMYINYFLCWVLFRYIRMVLKTILCTTDCITKNKLVLRCLVWRIIRLNHSYIWEWFGRRFSETINTAEKSCKILSVRFFELLIDLPNRIINTSPATQIPIKNWKQIKIFLLRIFHYITWQSDNLIDGLHLYVLYVEKHAWS